MTGISQSQTHVYGLAEADKDGGSADLQQKMSDARKIEEEQVELEKFAPANARQLMLNQDVSLTDDFKNIPALRKKMLAGIRRSEYSTNMNSN